MSPHCTLQGGTLCVLRVGGEPLEIRRHPRHDQIVERRCCVRAFQSKQSTMVLATRAFDEYCRSFLKIEEVGSPLKAEQVDDDDNKAHCVQSFDKTEDEAKMLAHQFVDKQKVITAPAPVIE